jgi:hypothetical protein
VVKRIKNKRRHKICISEVHKKVTVTCNDNKKSSQNGSTEKKML